MRKNYSIRYCLIVFLFFGIAILSKATTIKEETMVNLRLFDGLSGETVYRVMTDHSDHIWIATNNGVNAYNGKRITQFHIADESNPTVIVNDLCEVSSKEIWAATEAGIYRLPRGKKNFEKFLPEITEAETLLAVGDTVYIGGLEGLQVYDGKQLKKFDVGVSKHGLDNIVRHFIRDHGKILFLGRYGIYSFDPKTEKISSFTTRDELPEKTALTQFEKVGNRLFLGTHFSGLLVFDLQTRKVTRMEQVGNVVTSVRKSDDGYICVATDGAGAFLIDPESTEIVETFNTGADYSHQLPTNALYSYYRDKDGVNWFGFVRYGLAYTYHKGNLFHSYTTDGFRTEGMNVRSFCRHGNECVIGTHNGFWYIDTNRHITRYFSSQDFGGGHIVNSIVWIDGNFYIGTYDRGMRVLDPKSMTLRKLTSTRLLDNTTIGDIKVGPDGRLWVGSGEGLFIINKDGQVTRFTEQNSHIIGGLIISITFDRKGNAWLTGNSGISLYSAMSREIVKQTYPKGFFDKKPNMKGALGHNGNIYMRTGPQLFYTSEGMKEYGEIKMPLKFTDKWCRSFVDDMKGHYWIASERGLFRFDYHMKNPIHFGLWAGLRGDFINEMKIENDSLWVATSQGLYALPITENDAWGKMTDKKFLLYDIQRGETMLSNNELYNISENHLIKIGWNFFSELLQAKIIQLDYSKQTGRFYEYSIDHGEWHLLQDGESMVLKNLLLGKHLLNVRLAGIKDSATEYTIRVVPTIWFFIEVLFLIGVIILLWRWNNIRGNAKWLLSERNEMEKALIEAEEELEEVRDKDVEEEGTQKYQRVKTNKRECEDIVRKMKAYIERERIFTNQDLKMKDLADVLHLSAPKLSQVFNLYLNENYYEFINRYRLEEFKRLIDAGEYKKYTITALSEQCGFKKSNFYSTFRKIEGMTPAEYLRKKGIKI